MDASTALKKAQALATRSLGSSDRRRYIQHLLTLPTHHNQSLNEYYAQSITRDFSEFEEYQDQAVDAILDLCEDENEKTRISGIKALAEIGKVEPKWVRGNTGVLVQLLECPPNELIHVKKALFDLLEVSPSDVFSMMAEDVKSSEEESSRNILNFLIKDATTQRKAILESGDNVEAEHTFSTGFYDVLPTSKESVMILELLGTLSTVTGRNATRETIGKYAKALTKYTTSITAMKMWNLFTKTTTPDPRWNIYFLASHGGAVVKAAIEGDMTARGILEFYNIESQSRWRRILEDRDEKDLEMKVLLPKFGQTMIEAVLSHQNTQNTQILELTLHSIYTILTISRDTRDTIPNMLSRRLMDFGNYADRLKKASKSIRQEQGWRNMRDMAEIMGDRKERVLDIRLSWKERERSRSPVKSKDLPKTMERTIPPPQRSNPISRQESTPSGPPRSMAQPPSGPSRSAVPPPSVSRSAIPPVPRPEPIARPATPPSPPPIAVKKENGSTQGQSLNIKSQASAADIRPSIPAPAVVPAVAPDVVRPQASTSNLSIRARASATMEEPKLPAPAPTNQGLSIRSASTPTPSFVPEPVHPKPGSLLSRLAPSTAPSSPLTTTKRSRAEDFTPNTVQVEEPGRRSLVDRLGGSDKRQRVSSNPEIVKTPSLLSRMSQSQHANPSGSPGPRPSSPATTTNTPFNAGLAIKRSGTPQQPVTQSPAGLSIKRSGLPTAPSPVQSPGPGGFSIKNRSASSTSTPTTSGLKIKRETEPIPQVPATQVEKESVEVVDDAPIIRKGRGFAAGQFGDGEVLITPPTPVFRPSPSGRLQDRFSKFGPRG